MTGGFGEYAISKQIVVQLAQSMLDNAELGRLGKPDRAENVQLTMRHRQSDELSAGHLPMKSERQ